MSTSPSKKQPVNPAVVFWVWYTNSLKQKPILTKSVTSAVISILSDIFTQKLIQKQKHLNLFRTFKFAVWSFCVSGPVAHHYHSLLDARFKALKIKGLPEAIGKLVVDQLLFSPFILTLFFIVMNILDGNVKNIKKQIKHDLIPTLKVNVRVWPIANFINFYFVPGQFRVLFGNLISFGWNAYLSKRFMKLK